MSPITQKLARFSAVSLIALAMAAGCSGDDDMAVTGGDGTTDGAGGTTGQGGDLGVGPGGSDAAGGSGGNEEDPFACGVASSEAELEQLPADLIVVVDNSDSMALEASEVKANMNQLVGALNATGIDAHLIVISKPSSSTFFNMFDTGVCVPAPVGSGNCPNDENLPGYRHVTQEVGSNDALQKVIDTYDDWKGSLRPNATKTFLVVSDDESDMSASDFTTALAGLNPPIVDFKFNAIVASQEGLASCALCAITGCGSCSNPCCDKSLACAPISQEKGQTYMDLQTTTTGVYGDLCGQNFAPVFTDMATAVIEHTPVACDFKIPEPPNGVVVAEETNVEFVPTSQSTAQEIYNVPNAQSCTINGGWYFDNAANPTEIQLCPTTCKLVQESTDGEIIVNFGCKTQTTPN